MGSESNSGKRKAAIVTGSATGVGAATALALARRGYDVLINYSKSEKEAKALATHQLARVFEQKSF